MGYYGILWDTRGLWGCVVWGIMGRPWGLLDSFKGHLPGNPAPNFWISSPQTVPSTKSGIKVKIRKSVRQTGKITTFKQTDSDDDRLNKTLKLPMRPVSCCDWCLCQIDGLRCWRWLKLIMLDVWASQITRNAATNDKSKRRREAFRVRFHWSPIMAKSRKSSCKSLFVSFQPSIYVYVFPSKNSRKPQP